VKVQESKLRALVRMDDRAGRRCSGVDGHAECTGHQRNGGRGVNGPVDHPAGVGVQDNGAVHLAFSGGVLGDVGDP
jgi:hypothetical protein